MTSNSSQPPNRSSSDVTALLAELGRVIKARRFYGSGSAQIGRIFERALRLWQTDLDRQGSLEIAVEADGLGATGLAPGALAGQLTGLHGMLRQRGFRTLRVEAPLDAEGFAALLEVLLADAAKIVAEGGIEAALYARAPLGFVVNGAVPPMAQAAAAAAAPSAALDAPVDEARDELDDTAPVIAEPAAALPEPEPADGSESHAEDLAEDDGWQAAGEAATAGDDAPPPFVDDPTDPLVAFVEQQGIPEPGAADAFAAAPEFTEPEPAFEAVAAPQEPPLEAPQPTGPAALETGLGPAAEPEMLTRTAPEALTEADPQTHSEADPEADSEPGLAEPALEESGLGTGSEPAFADVASAEEPLEAPSEPFVAHDALPPIPPSLLGGGEDAGPDAAPDATGDFADIDFGETQAPWSQGGSTSAPAPESAAAEPLPAPPPPVEDPSFAFMDEVPAAAPPGPVEEPPVEPAAPELDLTATGPEEPAIGDLEAAEPSDPASNDLDFGGEFGAEPLELEDAGAAEDASGLDALDLDRGEPSAPVVGLDGEIEDDVGAFAREEPGFETPALEAPSLEMEPTGPAPTPPPSSDPDGSGYVFEVLRELEECDDPALYGELAERAANVGGRLAEQGLHGEAFAVLRTLFAHASDERKLSASQRDTARQHMISLAMGPLMSELLGRASDEGESSLEANQILLQLGGDVTVPVFRAAAAERGAERRERLHGVLIALGEESLPDLLRLMRDGEAGEIRAAARIAGELQNPGAVPRLSELLEHPNPAISQEASKALLRIGDPSALKVLADGLASETEHVPGLAAYALGASGSPLAAAALLQALHRSVEDGSSEFAREVIRSLGRLGRPEATPDLAAILLRSGMFQRRKHRELKLAAAAALGRLPGDEAVGALAQAAQSRDAHIRRAAQIALDRRAQALAGD